MLLLLAALLALNFILHMAIVVRHGMQGNEPPLTFGIVYAALAITVVLGMPYVHWAVLVVAVVGTLGLFFNWKYITHEKTLEQLIIAVNVVIIVRTAYLLFWVQRAPVPAA